MTLSNTVSRTVLSTSTHLLLPEPSKKEKTEKYLGLCTWSIGVAEVTLPLKIGNKRTAPGRLRETVLMRETLERMQGFEFALVAKPGDR